MLRIISILSMAIIIGSASWSAVLAGELKIKDIKKGTGAKAVVGSVVSVHYTGWLMNGKKFDSSVDRGQPFKFSPGRGRVIKGWEKGVLGMKVGGVRELIIPPELAYGKRGSPGAIPPNATLKFKISLLGVEKAKAKRVSNKFKNIDNKQLKDLLKKGVKVIDVRRPEEWKSTGVVKGSILMTFFSRRGGVNPAFQGKFTKLVKPDDKVIFICRTGNRSGTISRFLAERQGYKGVMNVAHGITSWIKEGNPVAKASMPKDCWLCAK